tara:strand:- start:26 stop:385 length:360 start_codon:yes stop_codon:yes gene_type:complete
MIHRATVSPQNKESYEKLLDSLEQEEVPGFKLEESRKNEGSCSRIIHTGAYTETERTPCTLRIYKDGRMEAAVFDFSSTRADEVLSTLEKIGGVTFQQVRHHTEKVIATMGYRNFPIVA